MLLNRHAHREDFNQSLAEWKLFIYNRTSGEFLGCTAKSWGLILLFYLVFYGFLAALFVHNVDHASDSER
ncbi:hypothetical protein Celaphus_00012066 [Cervus elaphus hippelaphus]|uniref:Sodium/potassium-dependent ATPase subunit beta-3 n=1 Tax=Cervus elaphus hippelaphus TaxID=46360 RepID=A0A212CKW8_CEREH|nr:hypothetical protein Celaphus_00012066 [Cervus elaphus hippelaphus]